MTFAFVDCSSHCWFQNSPLEVVYIVSMGSSHLSCDSGVGCVTPEVRVTKYSRLHHQEGKCPGSSMALVEVKGVMC